MVDLLPRRTVGVGRELLSVFPAVVIQGARQVGKSTLARQLVEDRTSVVVSLDDRRTRDAAAADEVAFVEQCPDGVLVIDEVQREPELMLAIKASIDRDRRPGRFLLTGSADMLTVKGRTDSLAGRAATLRLRGLSQGELAGHPEDFVAWLLSGAPHRFATEWNRARYAAAMAQGGYPDVRDLGRRLRHAWLDSYFDRVLERDAPLLPSGGQSRRLRSVLTLLAANQAGELVKARIADGADIPRNTITAYLDVLRSVYLVDELPPWTRNLTKREVGRPKAFVGDSALALRLNRVTEQQLLPLTSDAIGGLFEAFVASELLKQQSWSDEDYQLFHFRDRDGAEVDLVIELDDGRIIAIEVKASSTYRSEHFAGLRFLRDSLGDRFIAGVVVGMSDSGYQYADRLYGLPAAALWQSHT
ncbi:MAG: ATP-binding protein [Actinobacteria bacterium]|nr:ATP-binding protein [Actinomycetota bacterium]